MVKSNLLFSIIIPTYNRAAHVHKTIDSVLNQSYGRYELIIVDDGSTDDTEEIIKKYKDERIRYFKKENGERGAARNYGTKLAKGDYINFFDSDDLMYSNHLMVAQDIIKQQSSPEVFHVNFELRDEQGALVKNARTFTGNVSDYLILSNDLACNSVFVRRDVALEHPFNEDRKLASAEDWELWLRLAARYSFKYTNEVTHTQIVHATRSLVEIKPDRIIERDEYLLASLLKDELFINKFKPHLPQFIADRYTFITLNLALTKNKRLDTLHYLFRALAADFSVIFRRRFLASIKHWF